MSNVLSLKSLLNEGIVRFSFTKKDGSVRTAVGTRSAAIIPQENAPKNVKEVSDKVIAYWDLEKEAFRSLSVDTEVTIEGLILESLISRY